MKFVLNHDEVDNNSVRSGGIGIVKKDFHPAYRNNEREKSQISSTFDPIFQAKMKPIDNIL